MPTPFARLCALGAGNKRQRQVVLANYNPLDTSFPGASAVPDFNIMYARRSNWRKLVRAYRFYERTGRIGKLISLPIVGCFDF